MASPTLAGWQARGSLAKSFIKLTNCLSFSFLYCECLDRDSAGRGADWSPWFRGHGWFQKVRFLAVFGRPPAGTVIPTFAELGYAESKRNSGPIEQLQ